MPDYAAPIHAVEADRLIINREYRAFLSDIGLNTFDAVWRFPKGDIVKSAKQRSITKIAIRCDHGYRHLFIKKHFYEFSLWPKPMARLFPKRKSSQGCVEFNNICDFRRHNIATVIPIACGERFCGIFRRDSFLITESYAPYVSLEMLILHCSAFQQRLTSASWKKNLIAHLARFTRKMHAAGLTHCDYNADHILLHDSGESDMPSVALYDLQRIRKRKWMRFRWMIKSLAELGFSLPPDIFTDAEKVFLFLAYTGKNRLGFWDNLIVRWIRAKADRIRRHTEKHPYRPQLPPTPGATT